MQVHVSPDVGRLLDAGVAISVRRQEFFVGVEHLYVALLAESDSLPPSISERYGSSLRRVLAEVAGRPWLGDRVWEGGEVFYTPRCAGSVTAAGKFAEHYHSGQASHGHLLLALFADAHSGPSRAMDRLGIDRGEILGLLRAELSKGDKKRAKAPAAAKAPDVAPTPGVAKEAGGGDVLESLTRDLTQVARQGNLQPAIGRDKEIFEVLQILARKNKNNVMIVGEAGVGKTQLVEGMAVAAAKEGMDAILPGSRILELNVSALMAGTQYRGALEEKLLGMLEEIKRSKDVVLFIDEVHLIMGAGSTDGDSIDVANLLKPALARGEIRCIGATTFEEYRKFVEKDPAIERRFQIVRVEPLSEEASIEVLRKLRPSFERHHRVKIRTKAMEAAVALTQRYMPNRHLPDKAIDVLDQACARHRLKAMAAASNPKLLEGTMTPSAAGRVTPHDIRKVVSQVTAIPIEDMTSEERLFLTNLDQKLKKSIIGQDGAVAKAAAAVKKSRAGLADPNRPDAIMLFLGPSGVGKTQLAKVLADLLFGSTDHLVTFDMSEYVEEQSVSRLLGAAPGLVGSEQEGRLTQAVRNAPFSILLFDEIEKAHPRIFDVFLPIFDEGRLKDSRGRVVSFKNCIIILTSNIGAELLSHGDAGARSTELMDILRQHFRPEFINRIDEIVPFYPLLFEDVRSILRLHLKELQSRLQGKEVGIRVYQRAYEYLAQKGYSPEYGARELRRTVEQLVVNPISDMILEQQFEKGDIIEVLMEDGKLEFRKGKPRDRGGHPKQ